MLVVVVILIVVVELQPVQVQPVQRSTSLGYFTNSENTLLSTNEAVRGSQEVQSSTDEIRGSVGTLDVSGNEEESEHNDHEYDLGVDSDEGGQADDEREGKIVDEEIEGHH